MIATTLATSLTQQRLPAADAAAERLSQLATQALVAEANLTPKPALVDSRGSGAHADLSLEMMHGSALSIAPHFRDMAVIAANSKMGADLLAQLRVVGIAAEAAMLSATNGSNSHKGAIWSLGLLVAAARILSPLNGTAFEVAGTAGCIAQFENGLNCDPATHGAIVKARYSVTGARGEAQQSFPHVIAVGLPALRRRRAEGAGENIARLDCLFSIMSSLDDTCLLYRGGLSALTTAKLGAQAILAAGGASTNHGLSELHLLDKELLRIGCSPGGSADLLAATLFLDAVERGVDHIEGSNTYKEA